jgi:cytoskeleton protein RodZ
MVSTVTPLVTDPPAAARAGADLRAARERLGLSLDDIVRSLRIRMPHLEALEEGRISLLPGNAYALAFVRTYANALGLDAEEMVRRFKVEAAEFAQPTELVFPVPMPERGLPAGAVLLLGLVLAIGAYAGWYRLSGEGRLPAETVTAIPERLAPLAEQAIPLPSASPTQIAGTSATPRIARSDGATPDPDATDMPGNPEPPAMAISPTQAAAAQLPSRSSDTSMVASLTPALAAAMAPSPAPDATRPDGSHPEESRIILRASAAAWIMVKDHAGTVLLNRTMKAGETWPVPPRSDLLLTAGNAGGTEILLDGVATPSLGAPGTVRRDMPLDPDQIKDGKLAGATAPQLASGRARQ